MSTNAEWFGAALELAEQSDEIYPAGLIVELLDQCDIQCPTCIAGSSPFLRNLRAPEDIAGKLAAVARSQPLRAVFLSGGEPTIHARLFDFMADVDALGVDRKVLITNGLRLAREDQFGADLLDRLRTGWEVFLQFDVLDSAVLADIRGSDFTDERTKAVAKLGSAGIATTLVAVAKRSVSLDKVGETVQFALDRPWIRGVQIQPIREAGRLENYSSNENTCLASDVHAVLERDFPSIVFRPYRESPLSVSLAYASRASHVEWLDDAAIQPSGIYLEPTTLPSAHFRISIMEYSDDHNWSSLRLKQSPLAVLQMDGSAKRVDDHWSPVGVDLGPLRMS